MMKVRKVLVQLHMIYFNMKSFEKHRAVICKVRFTQNNNRAVKPSLFVDASSLQAVKPTLLRVKLGYKAEKMEKNLVETVCKEARGANEGHDQKLQIPAAPSNASRRVLPVPSSAIAVASIGGTTSGPCCPCGGLLNNYYD